MSSWVHEALTWLDHPHGVVLVAVVVLGVAVGLACWPLGNRARR